VHAAVAVVVVDCNSREKKTGYGLTRPMHAPVAVVVVDPSNLPRGFQRFGFVHVFRAGGCTNLG